MQNVSYQDEIYLMTLVLRELEQGSSLGVSSPRFLDRFQADIAFLDESLTSHHEALCANQHLPGRAEYLRDLHRVQADFAAFLAGLARGASALGRALAPLTETFEGMNARHGSMAQRARRLILEAAEDATQERHVISDEEFRILLADDGAPE